jgi:type VI protein secretion system component Hcp
MTEMTFDLADVERLATTLDAIKLDDSDRSTLHAVFALAGQAAAGQSEDEVSGFSFPRLSGGLIGTFQTGGSGGGDQLEHVQFTFQKITVENVSGGTSATDDWLTPGS